MTKEVRGSIVSLHCGTFVLILVADKACKGEGLTRGKICSHIRCSVWMLLIWLIVILDGIEEVLLFCILFRSILGVQITVVQFGDIMNNSCWTAGYTPTLSVLITVHLFTLLLK